jgi:hypothetical protein
VLSEIRAAELTNILVARNGGEKTASMILARKHLKSDNFGRFKRRDTIPRMQITKMGDGRN